MTKFATNSILSCHGRNARGEWGPWKLRNPPNEVVGNKTWFCKIWYFWELDDKFNAQMRKPHACVKRSNENTFCRCLKTVAPTVESWKHTLSSFTSNTKWKNLRPNPFSTCLGIILNYCWITIASMSFVPPASLGENLPTTSGLEANLIEIFRLEK